MPVSDIYTFYSESDTQLFGIVFFFVLLLFLLLLLPNSAVAFWMPAVECTC